MSDTSGISRILRSYEEAYERLDVAAAVVVWPTVDRRALARAFGALQSQALDFQNCSIKVSELRATARCRGTLQVVRKIGSSVPVVADQYWLFEMRRDRTAWKIDRVSMSPTSGAEENSRGVNDDDGFEARR